MKAKANKPDMSDERAAVLVEQIEAAASLLAVIGDGNVMDELSPKALAATAHDIIERCKELNARLSQMTTAPTS